MITYQYRTHPRSRSITIRVLNQSTVVVTSPPWYPQYLIDRFVATKAGWVAAACAQAAALTPTTSQHIYLFGIAHKLVKERTETKPAGFSVVHQPTPTITWNNRYQSTQFPQKRDSFLKSTAEKYIIPRTHQLAAKMKTTFGRITLRSQRTRWGSCSSQGNLNFNWRLVHFPPEIIDYVIVHELAHRHQMNHSSAFWNIVKQYDPAYAKHRGWLKRNSQSTMTED